MIKITFNHTEYECTKAVKGSDYIRLYNKENLIVEFTGIQSFDDFKISGGSWTPAPPSLEEQLEIQAGAIEELAEMIGGLLDG